MLALPEELKQAQRQRSARPYVEVTIQDRVGSAARPRWTRVYTGPEPDEVHAIAAASDGSLIRLRIHTPTPELRRQVVTAPSDTSDFASWTSWRAGTRLCAVAALQVSGEVRAFAVDDGAPTQIYESVSTDNGASWGGWSLVFTAAGTVTSVAAAAKSDGSAYLLLWSVGATLYRAKRSAGAWGSAAAWTNTVNSISGVAVDHVGDFNVVVTGTEITTLNPTVWQAIYGDGSSQAADTWSGLTVITPSSNGASIVFDSPFITTDASHDWITYREMYTGTGGYSRPWWSHDQALAFADGEWLEPVPFNLTSNKGIAIVFAAPNLWVSTPFGVWKADCSGTLLDVSEDLVSFNLKEEPFATRAEIVLDNSRGRYAFPGTGAIAKLRRGARVRLHPGYRIPGQAPLAVSTPPPLYIAGWTHSPDTITLHCVGVWEVLEATRLRSSRQYAAGTKSIGGLINLLIGRAGFHYGLLSASDNLVNLQPAFSVGPGETMAAAIKRLLEKVDDRIRFHAIGAQGVYPQAGDASEYSYGGREHPILSGEYEELAAADNYVQSLAGTTLGESVDWDAVLEVYARVRVDQDKVLASEDEADGRAVATLRKAQVRAQGGSITVPANVCQQIYDVIDITETRAGLAGARRRVMGIVWRYEPHRGRFEQVLRLGGV